MFHAPAPGTDRGLRERHLAYAGCEQAIFSDGAIDDIYRYASGSYN
ncbi:hypothetical protein J41TS12_44900 [Paenibacillus antibioticophila]|uniref:Uncharacterized protein n=1 Tax=Paenibacillus antibioticophila TaxID=1274374 RepID=A0A919XX31_9BACL|nr:hypothetical protein [Paenibacillus antibioticophila]GIO39629.1 hypothetical protein J41TS12_44900 [Paenibacillus antibioticophila]